MKKSSTSSPLLRRVTRTTNLAVVTPWLSIDVHERIVAKESVAVLALK